MVPIQYKFRISIESSVEFDQLELALFAFEQSLS